MHRITAISFEMYIINVFYEMNKINASFEMNKINVFCLIRKFVHDVSTVQCHDNLQYNK